jgi:hypothetical protein
MMAYLQARVEGNAGRMQGLSCASWDSQALVQAQSFRAMKATLDGVGCSTSSQDENSATVSCWGQIVTEYNGETRNWPLGNYAMVAEGGQWRMCGES